MAFGVNAAVDTQNFKSKVVNTCDAQLRAVVNTHGQSVDK